MTEQRDPTEVPTEHENPVRRRVDGLVIVNTGDGKGKSTAAFGTVMRAIARGWKVAVIQYIKSGNWHVGEEKVCRDQLGVDWWAIGEGFTWESEDLDEDQMVARVAWDHTKAVLSAGDHQMVVLDEGRTVVSGSASEVLTEANLARYYGARVRIIHDSGHPVVLPLREVRR